MKAKELFGGRGRGLLLSLTVVILLLGSLAHADVYWTAATANWSATDPCPWSSGTEPIGTTAHISNGGTAVIDSPGEEAYILNLGDEGTGTVQMTGGGLDTYGTRVGYSTTGRFTQSGGTHTPNYLSLANAPTGVGTYILSGTGSISVFNDEYVGYKGSGTFEQYGGTHSVRDSLDCDLHIGYYWDSRGTFNMRGGSLSCGALYPSYAGTGIFNQTGGTVSARVLSMAAYRVNSTCVGTYNLSNGTLDDGAAYVGVQGTATFTQSGGTHTVSEQLCLGSQSSAQGTYNLNGGKLVVRSLVKGDGSATFNFGGGTLQASNSFDCALTMRLTRTGGDANLDTAGNTVTLSGLLWGVGGLHKLGSGTLILGNVNKTYTGPTTISAGTLLLGASTTIASSSTIDVQEGATFDVSAQPEGFLIGSMKTLKGKGTLVGNVTAMSGSHIAPGESPGVLTIDGNLTLNSGSRLDFDLGAVGGSDSISMGSSTLSLEGLQFSNFIFSPLDGFGPGDYLLVDADAISGDLGDSRTGFVGGLPATLAIVGNDLVLDVVPEPSVWTLLTATWLAQMVYRGRRQGRTRR